MVEPERWLKGDREEERAAEERAPNMLRLICYGFRTTVQYQCTPRLLCPRRSYAPSLRWTP